ncbi:RNA methyltransferase [Erysipelotrichaceae bacterium RD49]|nr:RNA methyltransferase [Erysipelotrichaceae bacterium RD49]
MKIESTQNSTIKALAKLSTKKERDHSGKFLIEGWHLLEEASQAGLLEHVYQLEIQPVFTDAPVTFCTQPVLNKLSVQKSDARYIGLCCKPDTHSLQKAKKVLLLDHLQDPGNLGTLIRSALSFGLEAVVLSPDCADPYGPKAIQSSQGALFHIPVETADLSLAIADLKSKEIPVFGAALHQDSRELHDLAVPARFAIMIGNEGQGIRPELLEQCTQLIHIEMASFESLNAAIAGSILMYAFQFPAAGHYPSSH